MDVLKSPNKLSIIIAYRNESRELPRTIMELRSTAGATVDIIVVDDASDDNYDLAPLFSELDVRYLRNPVRLGCGPSRDIGIAACMTPYIFIIDGHMRFYDNTWSKKIISALDTDPRAIYCCRCKPIDFETGKDMIRPEGCGAYIDLFQHDRNNVLELSWIKPEELSLKPVVEIPCVLGACYAATKEYWLHLKGLEGISFYSCDEQYISIKAWMEGGGCRLLNEVTIGHLFRKQATYEIRNIEFFHNKLVILQTLFPADFSKTITRSLKAINVVEYVRARDSLDIGKIDRLKQYYSNNFKSGFDNFIRINDRFSPKTN